MKVEAIANPGMEVISEIELKELGVARSFDPKDLMKVAAHAQSLYRLVLFLGNKLEEISFDWKKIVETESKITVKIEVENVKGQENRLDIARKFMPHLMNSIQKSGLQSEIDLKNPDFLVIVYRRDYEYVIGIDLCGEMNSRDYRVFPHSGSFKGDLAYFFIRKSDYNPNDKLLCGFSKDGTLPIEAALYSQGKPVRDVSHLKKYGDYDAEKNRPDFNGVIHAFDESRQNITAARKNSKLSGVQVDFQKYMLDELDVRFEKGQFDHVILHITKKDEDKINELYYQLSYILKKGGSVFIIARVGWELSLSSKFDLVRKEDIIRGESTHRTWLLTFK